MEVIVAFAIGIIVLALLAKLISLPLRLVGKLPDLLSHCGDIGQAMRSDANLQQKQSNQENKSRSHPFLSCH